MQFSERTKVHWENLWANLGDPDHWKQMQQTAKCLEPNAWKGHSSGVIKRGGGGGGGGGGGIWLHLSFWLSLASKLLSLLKEEISQNSRSGMRKAQKYLLWKDWEKTPFSGQK